VADGALENNQRQIVRQLKPEDSVLRVLLKAKYLDFLDQAFIRKDNETGLSVCFDCKPEECLSFSVNLNRSYGVASLLVGGVDGLALTIVPDALHHAEIRGMPTIEENAREAEFIATQLARMATIVERVTRKKKQ
jgi:hypothetical protein